MVGGGVSGIVVAWSLRQRHEVVLLEKNDYLGGHTHTHKLDSDGKTYNVDSGFIVYNNKTYPNFIRFLGLLGVAGRKTTMSFSVCSDERNLEYNGTSINSLFAQRRNILRPSFWRMISGILRFNRECKKLLVAATPSEELLGSFVARLRLPTEFTEFYIKPMTAAVWSAGTKMVESMPIFFIARFFENHGFLNIDDRPQWYTVEGGSSAYAEKVAKDLGSRLRLNCGVASIKRNGGKPVVTLESGEEISCDHVVMACHSDQAARLIEDKTPEELEILSAIRYVKNDVAIHTDTALMPRRRLAWAAWNYHLFGDKTGEVAVTYNMNILQGLNSSDQFLVTLNSNEKIDPDKMIKTQTYDHPYFDYAAVAAQERRSEISGKTGIHYCGAYWANGFHEDGVVSALAVVQEIDRLAVW